MNIILTSYFIGHKDLQRNITWKANHDDLVPLIDSCVDQDCQLVILNNCFPQRQTRHIKYVRRENHLNPYFGRWLAQYQYLRDHPEVDKVFIVDATDTQILNRPFDHMESGTIYVGDEPSNVGCAWMRKNFGGLHPFVTQNARLPLLNPGVVGGDRLDILALSHDIYGAYLEERARTGELDPGIFNWLCYMKYRRQISHGRQVTTVFKKYETQSSAWIKHK